MPAAFITSPTLAPARPRSRSRRDALATIRPWLLSFSPCDIRIGLSKNSRLTAWKIVIIFMDVNYHPNWADARRANMAQPTILVTAPPATRAARSFPNFCTHAPATAMLAEWDVVAFDAQ